MGVQTPCPPHSETVHEMSDFHILTSDMLCDVDKKISICGLILGFITVVVNWVNPKSTTSLNLVATAPRSDKHV